MCRYIRSEFDEKSAASRRWWQISLVQSFQPPVPARRKILFLNLLQRYSLVLSTLHTGSKKSEMKNGKMHISSPSKQTNNLSNNFLHLILNLLYCCLFRNAVEEKGCKLVTNSSVIKIK